MPWASYQIRKIASCACAGNAGNDSPRGRLQRKPVVSDTGMHHGTCVTHVPWCMSGSLTRGGGENVPGIPGACAPAILRIWQEAHVSGTHAWVNSSCCGCNSSLNEVSPKGQLVPWVGLDTSYGSPQVRRFCNIFHNHFTIFIIKSSEYPVLQNNISFPNFMFKLRLYFHRQVST